MNPLFERLRLQAHLREIIRAAGDQGWEIISQAVAREIPRATAPISIGCDVPHSKEPSTPTH